MSANQEFELKRQAEAAKRLVASISENNVDDDAELVADMIEGETNLLEAIDGALAQIDECEVLIEGLKLKEREFEARRKSMENRAERIRALIEQAMIMTGQTSLRLATGTISLRTISPSLVILNEADIPAKYWIEQERPAPKLNKKALSEALEGKENVPGATLDNGGVSMTLRRK